MMTSFLSVAAGGAIGASGRYLTNVAMMRLAGPGFPWGTVAANLLGSFMMGVLVVVLAHKGGMRYAPFLMTGVLGGYTTFSAFSLDAYTLYERGAYLQAGGYVFGSVALGLAGLVAGMAVARGIFA